VGEVFYESPSSLGTAAGVPGGGADFRAAGDYLFAARGAGLGGGEHLHLLYLRLPGFPDAGAGEGCVRATVGGGVVAGHLAGGGGELPAVSALDEPRTSIAILILR